MDFSSFSITDFLVNIAAGLLIIALPVVIAAAFQHLRVMTKQLDDKIGEDRRIAIVNAIKGAVQVAEQAGIIDGLIGPEKREHAIQYAENYLKEKGVNLDLDQMADLVEHEVKLQLTTPTPPEAIFASRQALVDKAIETAVLAAEQSGMKGDIENTGQSKKEYAIRLVAQYLEQYGVTVPEGIISAMIDAQILRFVLAAKGQLPQTGGLPAVPQQPSQPTPSVSSPPIEDGGAG